MRMSTVVGFARMSGLRKMGMCVNGGGSSLGAAWRSRWRGRVEAILPHAGRV